MNTYQKLWGKAIKIIPGGNGLLSKRPQRFSPNLWPIYFKRAKDIYIWDLNNKKYTDMSIMGIGTSMLGYANNKIDNAVKKTISKGINTTLNSVEEYQLAKKILKIDKFANKVKFARSGGEAVLIGVRIARSYNKRTKIAFSGYHGWHDWYLAANLKNKTNLNNHLMKNLSPIGVPKELKNSNIPINFNDMTDLKRKFSLNKFSAFVVEPGRFNKMSKQFAKEINKICKKKNVCLIVDEITCGWRSNLGGLYKKIGLKPDIVIYGKALGNGYAISSIVGKEKYMKFANKSFISSTAWTERIGFAAAIHTIKTLEKKNFNNVRALGKKIKKKWSISAKKNKISIEINDYDEIPSFKFMYKKKNEILETAFTNFYLKHNILASNSVYLSFSHSEKKISKYLNLLDDAFEYVKNTLIGKNKINSNNIKKFNY